MTWDGKPSRTAVAVAVARGLGGVDPLAEAMLPRGVANRLRAALGHPLRRAAWVAAMGGLVEHLRLRTLEIDAAVDAAALAGARSLVVLGAGLDTRAFRLASCRGLRCFEVDHPATATGKARRVGRLPAEVREGVDWRAVGVDFGRDDLGSALLGAGFDPTQPCVWVWEGVTMYLPPEATRGSLQTIAALSAPGSRLAVSYMVPSLALPPISRRVALAAFRRLGEPLLGPMSSAALADALGEAGFAVLRDGGHREWVAAYGGSSWRPRAFAAERLAVAERLPAPAEK